VAEVKVEDAGRRTIETATSPALFQIVRSSVSIATSGRELLACTDAECSEIKPQCGLT